MKYIFLCHSIDIGGLETYMLRFTRWMSKNNSEHELHIICKSGKFGSYESEFRKFNAVLYSMPLGYFNPIEYFQFYRFLRTGHYDAVCDFGGDFGALPMLVAYASNTPKCLVFYRSARNAYKSSLYKRFYKLLLNRLVRTFSTHVLSNSQEALDYFFTDYPVVGDRRFQVIRNGIPISALLSCSQKEVLRQELGILPGQKIILHVGSGRWEKNHACMLRIARYAQDNKDNLCFCFAGLGVEKAHGAMADQLGLKNIRFLGERRDVDNLFQITDVFLFPSLSEGQPNALLEAMTSGVPFIASDIAPVRESLPPDWNNRWLFPPEMPEQGYLLLQKHLTCNFREDSHFKELVDWCRKTYDEDRCFGEFLDCLSPMHQ